MSFDEIVAGGVVLQSVASLATVKCRKEAQRACRLSVENVLVFPWQANSHCGEFTLVDDRVDVVTIDGEVQLHAHLVAA